MRRSTFDSTPICQGRSKPCRDPFYGCGDRAVIRPVAGLGALRACIRIKPPVAGHDRPIADLAHGCRVVHRAVAVHDQPGISRKQGRRIEQVRNVPGDLCGADVPGDMPRPCGLVEPEFVQRRRKPVAGMVAQQNRRRPAIGVQD
jgi:hypothetical protein